MNETGPTITTIVFDCDGVLVDSEVLGLEIELAAMAELGLACDAEEHMLRYLGLTGPEWYAKVENEHLRLHGRPLPPAFRRRCEEAYHAAINSNRLLEVAGAGAFVAQLTCGKAVASSSSARSLETKLRRTLLWDHFSPHIYSAQQVRHGKPEPDLFLHVASQLGVDPAGCLVVEDSVHGVTAARRAGMHVWGFTGGRHMLRAEGEHLLQSGAHRILRNWREAEMVWRELQNE